MSSLLAARALVDAACEAPGAPEGVELFRWWWVPLSWMSVRLPVESSHCVVARTAEIPPYAQRDVMEIRPVLHSQDPPARVGWNVEHRCAALFFAEGGTLPRREDAARISDTALHAIANDGAEIRFVEGLGRLMELLDESEPWWKS